MSSSTNSPCAACKCLRRKCTQECVFAPYFPPDNPRRFTSVHRVFGASNVAKLLNELNAAQRDDAVKSLAYEAEARLRDPVYGCVGLISFLHGRLRDIQLQLNDAKKELATYIGPQAFQANMNMNTNMNMNMPPTGILTHGVIPQSHNNMYGGFPINGLPAAVLAGGGVGGGGGGQLVIRDGSQQHQILEAQQMAVAVKEQQDMIREYEQQYQQNNNNNISSSSSNQEFVRFGGGGGGGFDLGSVSGSGFNDNNSLHIGGGGGVVSVEMAPSLALGGGLFDGGAIQVAAEGEHGHQQQQIQAAQLMLSPQQQQQQRQQQGHQQAESEEGRNGICLSR